MDLLPLQISGERIVYISVLNNISIDCDCDGNPAEPDIHDIGILASYDSVAIDQASIDLAFAAEGSESQQNRVNDFSLLGAGHGAGFRCLRVCEGEDP